MIREKPELMALFNYDTDFKEDIEDAIEHGFIVSNMAYMVSKELGLGEEYSITLADAGILHDIGKLQLGNYLYGRRENALNIEEMRYVRMHPSLGYEYLKEKGIVSEEICEMVKHHHENFDGSGYPDNIKGEDIPLGSRILRICDVYAALISRRPYRKQFDRDTALVLMIDEVKNFDMKIFLAFMSVIHSNEFEALADYVDRINKKQLVLC